MSMCCNQRTASQEIPPLGQPKHHCLLQRSHQQRQCRFQQQLHAHQSGHTLVGLAAGCLEFEDMTPHDSRVSPLLLTNE